MTRPYDASLKELIEQYPADWLPLAGLHTSAAVEVIDTDLSTLTAAADKVLRIQETPPWLMHVELQSSPKSALAEQLHWYNALLRHRHDIRVRTVLVLLRPSANSPALAGVFQDQFAGEPPYLEFRYRVVRVWEKPVAELLGGGLGTLPLAPISAVAEADLPTVVRQIGERLAREAPPKLAPVLAAATFVLTGLRLPPDEVIRLYEGVHFMSIIEESSAYQIILDKGRAKGLAEGKQQGAIEELRKTLVRLGRQRFGPPAAEALAALEAITDLSRLEQMSETLLTVANWQELLREG